MTILDLSHNFLYSYASVSNLLLLKNNLFNGLIPESLCNKYAIGFFFRLSWKSKKALGCDIKFQPALGSLGNLGSSLQWLALNNNSFHGELPKALTNCTSLTLLDLGENKFFGVIHKWIGDNRKVLVVLMLHKNGFTGPIPIELCKILTLQIMDLGENKLT
uniref:Leucine-rich repeat-containing N-terminal plant-type domain-containing protein n=1 Tax=Lactuca sativa TaxID=4236 RepID=A0A9R1VJU0_LACSA|nr:hypothetical protein LSAT_V11C500262080 [Lactuca sativa]